MYPSTNYSNQGYVPLGQWHNAPNTVIEFLPSEAIVSNEVRRISEIVIDFTISFILSVLGVFSNIIVMAVFAKQGFKDSVGITMTTIAAWDFLKSIGGLMQRLAGPMSLWSQANSVSWANISVVVFNYLVSFSSYVTSVLAAYVAVERCLCVTMPLKVKGLITPRIAGTVCLITSVTVFGCFAVIFGIYDVYWVFDSHYNKTIAKYRYNSFSANNTALFDYYNISGALWPLVSLLVIIVSTFIIVYKLRKAAEFRNKETAFTLENAPKPGSNLNDKISPSPNATQPKLNSKPGYQTMSRRDRQVIKMLLVIIVIYIISLFPRVIHYIAKYFVPEFYYLRKFHNFSTVSAYIVFAFDFLNGSVNLFVFLAMSSSFRATFLQLFPYFGQSSKLKE